MKISQITFTRFIAAMAIVISHFNKDLFLYKIDYISNLFLRANVGVSYFFILSGFIMIIAYHKKDKIDYFEFYKNRFARIYPLYIVGLLLYFITRSDLFDWYKLVLYSLGIQTWIPGEAMILNFPGWSISVEFLFYLLFPLLYNHFYSKKNKTIWVVTIVLWLITQVFSNLYPISGVYEGPHTKSHEFLYYFPIWHLNEFLIGNLAGMFFVKNFKQKNYDVQVILIFLLILLSLMFVPLFYHNGLMALLFVPAILLISGNNGKITKLFSMKPLEYLGEISYAVYITHIPVLYLLREFLKVQGYQFNSNIVFAIYVIVILITSALFYQCIEKPMRNLLRKISFTKQ
ncbi:acyltransferase [Chryseobacterium sp. MEBOG06]|uniref:acyltransferase family protein n=1 Tax=unclassified Chryseobacterium TaxID=2593645 RepID=UPI001F361FC1|nr:MULTISPECIES: acyltransferase [unclassified Chryseobacterium]UKB84302.1 acyltransferase [Chryseobacterium sp. MEBOG06]